MLQKRHLPAPLNIFPSAIRCLIIPVLSGAMLQAAPVSSLTLEGPAEGPVVRVIVARTERGKACGLDKQLAGLELKSGRLIIETHEKGKPIVRGSLPGGSSLDWELEILWPDDVKDDFQYEAKPSPQSPHLAGTDPAATAERFKKAAGDSFSAEALASMKADAIANDGTATQRMVLRFPAPRSGVPKSRQFRMARRLASGLLQDLRMIDAYAGPWPPNFPPHALVCNYDAEGVGYYGSTLLERVVDETSLDVHVVSVCPEDIREGALAIAKGVLFPGGSGREISRALRPEGVALVRDFVAGGKGFFGVCAGAYFAASGLEEYTGMMHLKHSQPWAKGKGVVKMNLTPEGVNLLGSEFSEIETRYNCGPVFMEITDPPDGSPHQPVTVLARFGSPATDSSGVTHDSMVGTPAILSTTWKKGRVMTISPHPESHPEFNALVGRCIGWSLGKDTKSIHPR